MLSKHTIQLLQTAAAGAASMLTVKYLESKETREKLVSNIKEIGDDIGNAIGDALDRAEEEIRKLKE